MSPGKLEPVFASPPVPGLSRVDDVGPGGMVLVYVAERFCPSDGRLVQYLPDGRIDEPFGGLLNSTAEVFTLLADPDGISILVAGDLRFFAGGQEGSELLWLLSEDIPTYSFDPQAFTYSIRTVPGREYAVECTGTLLSPTWSPCFQASGDGWINHFRDPLDLRHRYYRFVVTRP